MENMKNRIYKFRAWDTINKEYIEHVPEKEYMIDEEDWDHHDLDEAGGFYPGNIFSHFAFTNKDEDRIIFEQYTGLKDKNEKEIFEGDIVKAKRSHSTALVQSDKNSYKVDLVEDGEEIGLIFWASYFFSFSVSFEHIRYDDCDNLINNSSRYEVIGNINENSELLKKL